ncbi:MAG TPA: HEAT repeat domain-containing protein [Acidimicrobiia bacterium]|nr:HEAT repeat domain-containing protein [Acidimicrobiia bacterium]
MVAWMVALFAVTQMSHGLSANAADALFFLRFGVDDLPVMILLSGPAVMIVILLHGIGLAARGARRWLWQVTLMCAVWSGLGWAAIGVGQSWVYPFIWISTQVIIWLTFTMMWNGAESACTTRQAKRLFPLFATGGVVGGVLGNALTGPLASLFGTQHLLLAQAVLLIASTFLLLRIRHLFHDEQPEQTISLREDLKGTISTIPSSPLLKLAAVTALLFSILSFLVIFPFSEAVASSFGTEAQVAGYLGVFSSLATSATFLVSLLVTKRLFARLGIVVSLMIVPLTYVVGFSLWLLAFGLITAALVRGLQWVSVNAIGATAYPALFNVVTGRRRGQIMALMTAVPGQIGTMIAGAILIVGRDLSNTIRFGGGLVIAVASLGIVIAMRPAYTTALVAAVRKGFIGVFDVPQRSVVTTIDAEARRVLEASLVDTRPDTRAMALSALARAEEEDAVEQIEQFMTDESAVVRVVAFDSMCSIDPDRILDRAQAAITDPSPEVRLRVLQVMATSKEGSYQSLAASSLDDPHPRVAAAAAGIVGGEAGRRTVSELLKTQDASAITAVLEEMVSSGGSVLVDPNPYLHHPHWQVRAVAVSAYPLWGGNPEMLLNSLDDASLRVRRAAARSLARMPEGKEMLCGVLTGGSVTATEEALRALTPMDSLIPVITDWATQEAKRVARLKSLKLALEGESSSPTAEFLMNLLTARAARLEQWVLLAVTTDKTKEILPILGRGLRSPDTETRDQAIEALEMAGDTQAMGILLPLLEGTSTYPTIERASALDELLDDFDPWLRALAARSLAEEDEPERTKPHNTDQEDPFRMVSSALPSLADVTTDRIDTLSPMDRVLALHRVPMFAELDPEDLELIARVTAEVHFEAHQPIYREGEEAAEMVVIVEGGAVVHRQTDGSRQIIRSFGSGEHVGELALLSGDRRSADVTAGNTGLHGIVVTKVDLLSILEERPPVALAMLATLARLLAEQ